MKGENPRRTDRISLSVPIQVLGTEITGQDFVEEARTVSISRHGATIVLGRKLAPVQQVTLRRVGSAKEAIARVVGQIGGQPLGFIYGVALLDPAVNLWGIEFPPLTEAGEAVVRLVLECNACQSREVTYLDELEAEVFEANGCLSRSCKQCNEWTVWKQTFNEPAAGQHVARLPVGAAGESSSTPAPRAKNKRKDVRVRLKEMTACIRQPGFEEETVRVENVSRGGLRFLSPKTYYEGSRIEVAVPYTPGAANIFVPARIVRSRELPEKALREYGVAYLKSDVTQARR